MLETVITSSVLIAVIALLRALLKNRISARLTYALWLVAALRLMLPFSLASSPVSVMNMPQRVNLPEVNAIIDTAAENGRPALSVNTHDAQNDAEPAPQPALPPDTPLTAGEIEQPQYVSPPKTTPLPDISLEAAVRIVWALGAAMLAVAFIVTNGALYFRLHGARERIMLPGCRLRVYLADGITSPCLFGLFRPSVYLTKASLKTRELTNMVLMHEETHYRHGDHLWSLLRCVLLCTYWFNPFVWLAAYLSRRDAELACDESCMAKLGYGRRLEYGHALVDLLNRSNERAGVLGTATTMSGGKRAVKERVTRIVRVPRSRAAAVILILVLVFAVTACTFTGALPSAPTASAGEPLANASAYTRMPDGSVYQEGEAHKYVWAGGRLELYDGEENAFTADLDSAREPGVFLSDTLNAVAYIDGAGMLNVKVNGDADVGWEHESALYVPEVFYTQLHNTFVGFSDTLNGWVVQTRWHEDRDGVAEPGEPYSATVWLTEDGGASWEQAPYGFNYTDMLAGIAITEYGEAVYATNGDLGRGEVRLSCNLAYSGAPVYTNEHLTAPEYGESTPLGNDFEGAVTLLAPRIADNEAGFEYFLLAEPRQGEPFVQGATLDDVEGFYGGERPYGWWRIPEEQPAYGENSVSIGDGLYVTPLPDRVSPWSNEFLRRFWHWESGPDAQVLSGDISAVAAFSTTEEKLNVTVYLAGESNGTYNAAGPWSVASWTLTPKTAAVLNLLTVEGAPRYMYVEFTSYGSESVGSFIVYSPSVGQVEFIDASNPLAMRPAVGALNLALHPDGVSTEGGDWRYYVPENQTEFMAALDKARGAFVPQSEELKQDSGIWLWYEDEYYELLADGTLRAALENDEGSLERLEAPADELLALAKEAVKDLGMTEPVQPEEISGIVSATLSTAWDVTVTDPELLAALEAILADSDDFYGVPSCFFTSALTLEFADKAPLTIYIASDSCGNWASQGVYYQFHNGNARLYALFGSSPDYGGAEDRDSGCGVRVNYLSREIYEQYPENKRYHAEGFPPRTEFLTQMVIMPYEEISNLRIFGIEYGDEAHSIILEGDIVFEKERVSPDELIIFDHLDIGSMTSTRGFAFTDADGAEHRFMVFVDSEYGGVGLREF